jgi:hypothetical protein
VNCFLASLVRHRNLDIHPVPTSVTALIDNLATHPLGVADVIEAPEAGIEFPQKSIVTHPRG